MTDAALDRPSLGTYLDPRMPRILLLGAISGFPWVLIGSSLTLWLKDDGMSRSTIGFAGAIFSVYAFNWLWAPLIDRVRIPWLADRVGQRKAWILTLQGVILLMLGVWATLSPATSLALVVGVGLVIAIASASQDITVDALRIEQVGANEQAAMAAGAAVAVVGWWTGFKLGGLVSLYVAEGFEVGGVENHWQMTFLVLALMVVAMNLLLLLVPEVSSAARVARQREDEARIVRAVGAGPASKEAASPASVPAGAAAWFASTIVSPIASFFRANGTRFALAILAFVFLFKIGEAFVGKMSIVFYDDIGFSKTDIALYSKGLGWVTTVLFTLIGGWFAVTRGVVVSLAIAGVAMAGTNLLFAAMAWQAVPSDWLFALAVVVDDAAAAIATVIFVTFISLLVDRTYTATQYALLASIGTAGRTVVASTSGAMVDGLNGDWGLFFVLTALMVLPALALLWYLRTRLPVADDAPPANEPDAASPIGLRDAPDPVVRG